MKLFLSEETLEKFCGTVKQGEKTALDIVYEDDQVLFINKPVGMLSQKAEKEDVSLVEYLTGYLLDTGSLTEEDLRTFRPGVCNRLDRNTSGLVAAGKTVQGFQALSQCFQERSMHKFYLTLVKGEVSGGRLPISGDISGKMKRETVLSFAERKGGKIILPIETKYR